MEPHYLQSLIGGALIGLSAAAYLLLDGRIAGVSGALSGALAGARADRTRNFAFLAGLLCGPLLYLFAFGGFPRALIEGSTLLLALAGLLVGFGARLGAGCTSGHGVCGLARLSPRSFAAVATFMASAIATVALMNLAGMK